MSRRCDVASYSSRKLIAAESPGESAGSKQLILQVTGPHKVDGPRVHNRVFSLATCIPLPHKCQMIPDKVEVLD